ncbi:hypothetical protein CEXT_439581 [Caerostris extrusa]|uniref:Uncharacterized protein n=1 Tax=Caerostris extrusa TaxID=172846 RepID=A0AAV4XIH6_CAEEX|nr:hypothetical protein CEXT_439581 [Caerostris extrusa]
MAEINEVETKYSSILKDSLEYDISLVKKETDIAVESEPAISKTRPVIIEVRSVNINNSKVVEESNSAVLTRNSDIVEETDDTEIKYSEIMFASNNVMEAELNEESAVPDLPGSSMHKRQRNGARIPNKKRRLYSGMKGNQLCYFLSKEHIKFSQENKLIASSVSCFCGEPMVLKPDSDNMDGFLWCCPQTASHKTNLSVRKGSWFENLNYLYRTDYGLHICGFYNYSNFSMVHECNCSEEVLTCCLSKITRGM